MKTVAEIEKEYESFEAKTKTITSLEDFLAFSDINIDDIDDYLKSCRVEIRANKRAKVINEIKNFIFFVFLEPEDSALYTEDNELIEEMISLGEEHRGYFVRMQNVASEDNYQELGRLVDFTCAYFQKENDYYDFLRERLEMSFLGIHLHNTKYDDVRTAFDAFMNKKISMMEENTKTAPPKCKRKV